MGTMHHADTGQSAEMNVHAVQSGETNIHMEIMRPADAGPDLHCRTDSRFRFTFEENTGSLENRYHIKYTRFPQLSSRKLKNPQKNPINPPRIRRKTKLAPSTLPQSASPSPAHADRICRGRAHEIKLRARQSNNQSSTLRTRPRAGVCPRAARIRTTRTRKKLVMEHNRGRLTEWERCIMRTPDNQQK